MGRTSFASTHIQKWRLMKTERAGMQRGWKSVNLTKEDSGLFRNFLIDNGVRFETSGNGNLVHFEVFVNNAEQALCDRFLSNIN